MHYQQTLRPTRCKIRTLTLNLRCTDHRQLCSEAGYTLIIQSVYQSHRRWQRLICYSPSVAVGLQWDEAEMVSVSVLVLLLIRALWCCRSLLFLFVDSQNGLTHKLELTLKHTTDKVLPAVTTPQSLKWHYWLYIIFLSLSLNSMKRKKTTMNWSFQQVLFVKPEAWLIRLMFFCHRAPQTHHWPKTHLHTRYVLLCSWKQSPKMACYCSLSNIF